MSKIHLILICSLLLLAQLESAAIAAEAAGFIANQTENQSANLSENGTVNASIIQSVASDSSGAQPATEAGPARKILRAGFESFKPLNNLDVYGNRSLHELSGGEFAGEPFDLSQRNGNASQFTYNTDIYKPTYSVDQYRRTKAAYQAPDRISNRSVYSISGYPLIKTANSIP